MFKLKIGTNQFSSDIFQYLNTKYIEELEQAAFDRRLIYTGGTKRTGKTTALIQFGKKHGYNVIVQDFSPVKKLREEFDYKKIYMRKFYNRPVSEIAVIDENVSFTHDIDFPHPIITGFIDHTSFSDKGRPDWWSVGDASSGLKSAHFNSAKND
ncbi:hypothetical protein [Paenibacillus donghaensis]|uniref:Uncharacterized protein n=1 Tax=Paenibacillus donghaensis TaxID=414771 RepID=A0A2Z2K6J7_9BACL|nr:hypothetical protein [Paenibacillus donghaensis]ASA21806.1 hypothetical protein B9T62_14110 [Paenibacillus donghaensis]